MGRVQGAPASGKTVIPRDWPLAVPQRNRSTLALIHTKSGFKGDVPMMLIEGFDSNYRYILVAARRARQLQSGALPVVDTTSGKLCSIAQDGIRVGKVKWEIPETRTDAEKVVAALVDGLGVDSRSL